jgi:hypothetical protein
MTEWIDGQMNVRMICIIQQCAAQIVQILAPLLAGRIFLTIFHQQPLYRDTWSAAVRQD